MAKKEDKNLKVQCLNFLYQDQNHRKEIKIMVSEN